MKLPLLVTLCLLASRSLFAVDANEPVKFDTRTVASGRWSDAHTWADGRTPHAGDRVQIRAGHSVVYDVESADALRMVHVAGTLRFARDRNTRLDVGLLKVSDDEETTEGGFNCHDTPGAHAAAPAALSQAALEMGTTGEPIPAGVTARVRLVYFPGTDAQSLPAIINCGGRWDAHGAPMNRTWVKLGADAAAKATTLTLSEPVDGWKVGDEVIVTPSKVHQRRNSNPKDYQNQLGTEERRIVRIDGTTLEIDKPLAEQHDGTGEFRCEVANLSRNVIVESADPAGVRGHTMYHARCSGGLSYARFDHLGKQGVLGRYAIHFHLAGDTMRGSQVLGVAVTDSSNRWVTIHGTDYLIVRDCVGYRSAGHGFYLEDATELYNLLDRNLAVQAYRTKPLPKQALPFDQNEGAGIWWANGRNTIIRNVTSENDEYGYRYDMQSSRSLSSTLPITMPDGTTKPVDIRTIPNWRFDDNESHCDQGAGMVVACDGGNRQPDTTVRDQKLLDQIKALDWTAPDTQHPHIIRNLKIWETHYAFRPHTPSMLIDGLRIARTAYGVYRPAFDNQEYRNVHITRAGGEPFNRGMDDASCQTGTFTVDGLQIDELDKTSNHHTPIVQMSDNNLSGHAESHFRNVTWTPSAFGKGSLFNRGGQTRGDQFVEGGVPYYLHDYYGPGRTARIISTTAKPLLADGHTYHEEAPLTGDESVVAEVKDIPWPKLLDPIDDLPPATAITNVRRTGDKLQVTGITHDNGEITVVTVNGASATLVKTHSGVADWTIELPLPADGTVTAFARDDAGNVEQTRHVVRGSW